MSRPHASLPAIALLTGLTMLAFAANSLLTRMALHTTALDAASFTFVRIAAGAAMMTLLLLLRGGRVRQTRENWFTAGVMFIYAVAFSFSYRGLDTGAGALLQFASAQLLMSAYGYWRGEKTSVLGLVLALGGLVAFLAPSASAPPTGAAALMIVAGTMWGVFSLLGRASASPVESTASSFVLALPLITLVMLLRHDAIQLDARGMACAAISGALTSALAYVVWYWVRVRMTAISAGAVQLSVPVLSAMLGATILGEQVSFKSGVSAAVVLAGVALVTTSARQTAVEQMQ